MKHKNKKRLAKPKLCEFFPFHLQNENKKKREKKSKIIQST